MSRNKNTDVLTEEVTEPVIEETVTEEPKTLTLAQKIQKQLDAENAKEEAAKKAIEAAATKKAELEKLTNLGDDVMTTVETLESLDKDISTEKAKYDEIVKPFNAQIAEAKKTFDEGVKTLVEARTAEYTKLVEAVGETGAKTLTGKTVSIGTGTGRGRSGNTRAQVITAICDDGMSFAAAAEKFDHMGDGERAGTQKIGNLVKRHIDLAVKDGTVIKNDDGTYSRA